MLKESEEGWRHGIVSGTIRSWIRHLRYSQQEKAASEELRLYNRERHFGEPSQAIFSAAAEEVTTATKKDREARMEYQAIRFLRLREQGLTTHNWENWANNHAEVILDVKGRIGRSGGSAAESSLPSRVFG